MDAQFWIYIIIGVIFFLSKLLKKPEQPSEEGQDRRPERRPASQSAQTTSEKPKQLTFEELLREITEGKQPPKPQPAPTRRYESYEDDLKDEAQSLEEVEILKNDEAVFKTYEQAKSQVFQRSSLEDTLKLKDTVMDFGKFKEFEVKKKKKLSDDYMKTFRNPEGLKQAFVMSEILKRKF